MSGYYNMGESSLYGRRPSHFSPKKKPKKNKKRPPRRPGETIEQYARRIVDEMIKAQLDALEMEKKAYLDELEKAAMLEAQRGQAFSQELAGMNMPGVIQGLYGNAAHDISGMAKGFSGQVQNIASADAAQQQRMLSGSGQEGAVRNQGENMGNVTYGVGGFMPARSMTESGAAFGAQAAMEPGFALRIGQQEAARIRSEGQGELSEFAKLAAEIRGQRPLLEREIADERRSIVMEEREYQMKALEQERDWLLRQAAFYAAKGDDRRAEQYLKLARQREARISASARGVDENGNPLPGFKRDRNGNIVKRATPRAPSSRKPKGPDWGDIQHDIANDLDDLWITREVEGAYGQTKKVKERMPYQQAFNTLWNTYSGMVKNKARLRKLIHAILKRAGWKREQPKPQPMPPGPNNPNDPYPGPGR